jgi:hypothetical protein
MPYCGYVKELRGTPETCKSQIRLFGRHMVPREVAVSQPAGPGPRYCGAKTPGSKSWGDMMSCKRQWRGYGVYPIVRGCDDMYAVEFKSGFPRKPSKQSVASTSYEGVSTNARNIGERLLVVLVSKKFTNDDVLYTQATFPTAFPDPGNFLSMPGVVGYAFGHWGRTSVFNIIEAELVWLYRGAKLSKCLLKSLEDFVRKDGASKGFSQITLQQDPLMPCAQAGHTNYRTDEDKAYHVNVYRMYKSAGFDVHGGVVEERNGKPRVSFYVGTKLMRPNEQPQAYSKQLVVSPVAAPVAAPGAPVVVHHVAFRADMSKKDKMTLLKPFTGQHAEVLCTRDVETSTGPTKVSIVDGDYFPKLVDLCTDVLLAKRGDTVVGVALLCRDMGGSSSSTASFAQSLAYTTWKNAGTPARALTNALNRIRNTAGDYDSPLHELVLFCGQRGTGRAMLIKMKQVLGTGLVYVQAHNEYTGKAIVPLWRRVYVPYGFKKVGSLQVKGRGPHTEIPLVAAVGNIQA